MTFRIPAEKIKATDTRSPERFVAEQILQAEDASRAAIAALRARYNVAVSTILQIAPNEKVPTFREADFGRMGLPELKDAESARRSIVEELEARVPQLHEQREAERKANLSEAQALREELEALRATIIPRIAALERRLSAQAPRENPVRRRADVPQMLALPSRADPLSSFQSAPQTSAVRRIG